MLLEKLAKNVPKGMACAKTNQKNNVRRKGASRFKSRLISSKHTTSRQSQL